MLTAATHAASYERSVQVEKTKKKDGGEAPESDCALSADSQRSAAVF